MSLRTIFVAVIATWMCVAGARAAEHRAPCDEAIHNNTVCEAANAEARRLFTGRERPGVAVIEDVQTGVILVSTTPAPPKFSSVYETTAMPPLSIAKLFLAASIWTHAGKGADRGALDERVRDMVMHSADAEGQKLAIEERARVGSAAVLADLAQYGMLKCIKREFGVFVFGPEFLSSLSNTPLLVAPSCTELTQSTDEVSWGNAFSIGESNFRVTLLHLTAFMQAIGDGGVMLAPVLRDKPAQLGSRPRGERRQIMPTAVARQLQQVLLDTVVNGTAKGVKNRLRGGWRIGGKTGTTAMYGEPFDGVFGGLVFDPSGEARYAFVVYVQRGGKGGGAAAEIACDLFNYALGL